MTDQTAKDRSAPKRDQTAGARELAPLDAQAGFAIEIDWDFYIAMLEGSEMADADKRAFVECLFSIVLGFVDLGFRLHPLQQTDADDDIASIAGAKSADTCNAERSRLIGAHVLGVEDTPPTLPDADDSGAAHRRDFAAAADHQGDAGHDR